MIWSRTVGDWMFANAGPSAEWRAIIWCRVCTALREVDLLRVEVTADCAEDDVDALADFWAQALGYIKLAPFLLVDPDGVRPRLVFQAVPEPKVAKNRWHMDLYVERPEDLRREVERLVALGATEIRQLDEPVLGFTNTFTAMLDPRGNEFCVCAPHLPITAG